MTDEGDRRYVVREQDGIFWVAEQTYNELYGWHVTSAARPFEDKEAARMYASHLAEEYRSSRGS